jgi:hypothetical protein
MDSNRLAAIGEYLGLGGKAVTTGWKLWEACIAGDQKAWRQMGVYNRRDVDLLEQVYDRLAPWNPTAPYTGCTGCPSCYSERVTRQGIKISRAGRRQQMKVQRLRTLVFRKGWPR